MELKTIDLTDACNAMANAVHSLFPLCKVLMCYFHVKYNVRKHKALIPVGNYNMVMHDIDRLHMCTNEGSYKLLLISILNNWCSLKLIAFVDYFKLQWLYSKFKNWKIFCTPAGYAHTNSLH